MMIIPNDDDTNEFDPNALQWSIFQSQWMRNRLPFAVVSSHCHPHIVISIPTSINLININIIVIVVITMKMRWEATQW